MALVYVSNGALSSSANAATLTPALPASIAAGDLMMMQVAVKADKTGTINTPAGWTKISANANGTSLCLVMYDRVFQAGDTAPTVSWTGSAGCEAVIARYTGNDTTSPIGAIGTASTGSVSPHTSTALTTTRANSLVVLFDVCAATTTLTTPAGWSAEYALNSAGAGISATAVDKAIATSGTSSGSTSSTGGAAVWVTQQIELLSPSAGVLESGIGFQGRFQTSTLLQFKFNSWDQSQPLVIDKENPHFIGRFTPVVLNRFPSSWDQSQPPVIDKENPHFVGTFKSTTLTWFKYNSWDQSQPPVVDQENPHFIGRFKPIVLSSFRFNTTVDIPFVAPVVETNIHFVGQFKPTKLSFFQYNSWDFLPRAAETNTHFIGRFTPASLSWFKFNTTSDIPSVTPSADFSTNNLFVVNYDNMAPYSVALRRIYFHADNQPPAIETNPHFIGRFTQPQFTSFRFNTPGDVPFVAPVVSETNTHFVGKFQPTKLSFFAYNSWDTFPPAIAETNTHFIGRFFPASLSWFKFQSWDQSQPPVTETNTHFVGRFSPARFINFKFNTTGDIPLVAPVSETNTHFVGKFSPAQLSSFRLNSRDFGQPPVVETNVHFVGKFSPTNLTWFRFNSWDQAQPPVAETNPHFLGRYHPTILTRFGFNSNVEFPPLPIQAETNTNFIGQFKPTQFIRGFGYNSWDYTGASAPPPPPPPPPPSPQTTFDSLVAAYLRRMKQDIRNRADVVWDDIRQSDFEADQALDALIQAAALGNQQSIGTLDGIREAVGALAARGLRSEVEHGDSQIVTGTIDWRTIWR